VYHIGTLVAGKCNLIVGSQKQIHIWYQQTKCAYLLKKYLHDSMVIMRGGVVTYYNYETECTCRTNSHKSHLVIL